MNILTYYWLFINIIQSLWLGKQLGYNTVIICSLKRVDRKDSLFFGHRSVGEVMRARNREYGADGDCSKFKLRETTILAAERVTFSIRSTLTSMTRQDRDMLRDCFATLAMTRRLWRIFGTHYSGIAAVDRIVVLPYFVALTVGLHVFRRSFIGWQLSFHGI